MRSYTRHFTAIGISIAIACILHLFPHSVERAGHSEDVPDLVPFQKEIYIQHSIQNLSLEQKIGQLLFISIPATSSEDSLNSIIHTYAPGGILLFASNIQSKSQTQKLISNLNAYAEEHSLPPLFIATDEEGGVVERVWFDPVPYSARELGGMNSEETTRNTAHHTAEVLNELGINTVFAPVADIAYSSDSLMISRSFGPSAEIVAAHTAWAIEEFEKDNIFSTAKHFPGHGRTSVDSHDSLPEVAITKEDWVATDAIPFISAIDTGTSFIMTGHLLYSVIDSEITSTSSKWLQEILRDELEFDGIIISDDIKMGSLGTNIPQTAINALAAGNDMIIAAVDLDTLSEIKHLLLDYYMHDVHTDEIEDKLRTVLGFKYELEVAVDAVYSKP